MNSTSKPVTARKASLGAGLATAMLPLVMFWAIETYLGLEAALIAGCITAVAETAFEKWRRGRVGFMTWASNGLVLGLGAISYFMKSGVAFKLQPAVMEVGMAVMMVVMIKRGKPFLLEMMKENPLLDDEKRKILLANTAAVTKIVAADFRLAVFFLIHGLALAAVAVWASTSWWIFMKGVLFYVLLVLVMVPMYKQPLNDPNSNTAPQSSPPGNPDPSPKFSP